MEGEVLLFALESPRRQALCSHLCIHNLSFDTMQWQKRVDQCDHVVWDEFWVSLDCCLQNANKLDCEGGGQACAGVHQNARRNLSLCKISFFPLEEFWRAGGGGVPFAIKAKSEGGGGPRPMTKTILGSIWTHGLRTSLAASMRCILSDVQITMCSQDTTKLCAFQAGVIVALFLPA